MKIIQSILQPGSKSPAPARQLMPIRGRILQFRFGLFLLLIAAQSHWTAHAEDPFEFKVLARSGQADIGSVKSSANNPSLSLNDRGQVAFAAQLSAGGEGLFVSDDMPVNISPGYSSYTHSAGLQINNEGFVVTRTRPPSGPGTGIYIWYGGYPDARGSIEFTGGPSGCRCVGGANAGQPCLTDFDCYEVLPSGQVIYWDCRCYGSPYSTYLFPSINNLRQVAYLGSVQATTRTNALISTGILGEYTTLLTSPEHTPRLLIADNGNILGRMGDSSTTPIRLFAAGLTTNIAIATTANFSALGQRPGISDSGDLVAFYGDRISDGPGIFVYYVKDHGLVRVASQNIPTPPQTNIVGGFSADYRVCINNSGVVLFRGVNLNGQTALFRLVTRHCNNRIVSIPAKQVVAVGDTIKGLAGTVESLEIYDSLNNRGPGEMAFLAGMSDGTQAIVKATPKQCDICSVCIAGQLFTHDNSVDVTIGVGRSLDGSLSGSLTISSDIPSANLGSPTGLSLSAGGFAAIYDGPVLRQIKGRDSLADIQVETSSRYRIDFYADSSSFNSGTGRYDPIGSPHSTITVESPGGTGDQLDITRNGDLSTYQYHPEYNGWELITGFANALRKEALAKATNGTQRTETRTIRDGADQVLSKVISTFETFDWGEELVQTVEDPDGAARTTDYTFYTNSVSDGDNYGHLRRVKYPSGNWEFYKEHHPIYGVIKSVSQFQNNPYMEAASWPDPDNRSFEVEHSSKLETQTEYLKGHPVSRRWHNEISSGYTVDAVATNPSVTDWSDASNLTTTTYSYTGSDTNGAQAGRVSQVINPDGTAIVYAYYDEFIPDPTYGGGGTPPQIEVLRSETWSGELNAEKTGIVDGTVSEEVTDIAGNLLHRYEWDIASGVLIGSELVATRDGFGRPTRINYLDGTYTTRTYDCCGLAEQTDREGIVTTYNTDHTVLLDLVSGGGPETYYGSTVTRAGISTHTLTDALGRAFKTLIQGTNGALIVQDERHYNVLGELDWSKDAMGRTTTYSNAYVGGFTVNTTTFPDGSQSIGTSWQDGSAYETKGDAVQGLRYATDVVQDNGVWVQTSTQTRLETNGTPSAEYTTTYTDFAGRVYKTQYPWPDGGTNVFAFSEYNSKGQLAKVSDPDGVATLYQYNARGELETTATDMANPGVLDFAGTDRVTRTRSAVNNTSSHGVPVRTATTEIWESDNLDQPTVLQLVETSLDGATNWITQYGLTTRTVTVIDRNNQRRTVTTLNPDHTSAVSVFELGRQSSLTRYDSNSVQIARATFAYDAFGRLFSQTDARNGATLYTYYDDGQIHTVTTPDPDPGLSGPGYNPQTNSYAYFRDPVNGIKTVTTLPDGGNVTQQFYPSGQLKKTWGARTYPAAYTYDRAGRVDTLTTWQQFDFNTGNGLSGAATTKWHYNSRGLLAFKEYADGKGPTYTYTAGGKLNTRVWARGVSTTYGYDLKSGDLLTLTYSDSTPAVTNAYDRLGRLQSVTDASGTRQFGYQYGQTTTEAYAAGMFAGITLRRGLDPLNRLQSLTVTNPAATLYQVGYGYDAASRLQTVTSGPDVATYSYHPNADLVNTLIQTHSNQVRLTTTKLYDKLNRLQSISSVPSADSPISFAYQYNDANQRTRATLANGENWTYGYDALGQVTNGVKHFPNNAPVPGYSFGYQFDHIGNRLAATRDNRTDAYTNNALNQIQAINYAPWLHVLGQVNSNATITVNGQTPVRSNGYFYAQLPVTSIWNTVSIQARVAGAATNGMDALAEEAGHLLQPTNSIPVQYDDDGNILADGQWTFIWDAENRIIRKETLSALPTPARRRLNYVLDSLGRRVRVDAAVDVGGDWVPDSSRRYLAGGLETLVELDGKADNSVQAYIWGLDLSDTRDEFGGVGGLLSQNHQEITYLPAYDGSGNVQALTAAAGNLAARYDYDPFGATLQLAGPAAESNRFRFSTKAAEAKTTSMHYEYRDYMPTIGRWLNRDLIEENGGIALYEFARNSPINHIDRLGLTTVGQFLDRFFAPGPSSRLLPPIPPMMADDEYTRIVAEWGPVTRPSPSVIF